VVGSIKHFLAASVEGTNMNNEGEDSTAEQKVGDEQAGQGHSNWE